MLDKSTDKSVIEEVIVYARYVNIGSGEIVHKISPVKVIQMQPIYFQLL